MFLSFLAANILLSTFLLPAWAAWIVGLLLIVLSAWMLLRRGHVDPGTGAPPPMGDAAGIGMAGLLLAGFLLRMGPFLGRDWPFPDEGALAWQSLSLLEGEPARMFYLKSQTPFLAVQGLAFFGRLLGPSLFTLWFTPTFLALLSAILAILAARRLFGSTVSQLTGLFMLLGFWPVFTGRFSLAIVWVLFLECLAFYALAGFLDQRGKPGSLFRAIVFGIVTGLGLYSYHPWPFFVAALLLSVLPMFRPRRGFVKGREVLGAVAAFGIVAAPFLWQVARGGMGQYHSFLFFPTSGAPIGDHLPVALSNVQALFWGLPKDVHTYGPVWGGFLDPVTGSLVLLGLLGAMTGRREPLNRWWMGATLVFLAPGLLSLGWMPFRIILLLPLTVLLAAKGWQMLFARTGPTFRARAFWATGAIILLLTAFHSAKYEKMWEDAGSWRKYSKSRERSQAHSALAGWAAKSGPGLVFTEWVPGLTDPTLDYACYRFNAARNPALDPGSAGWGAVLANVHYQPFLRDRFPEAVFVHLTEGPAKGDGGWMLMLTGIRDRDRSFWERWLSAHRSLHPHVREALDYIPPMPADGVLASLLDAEPLHRNDPFLRSVFWEKAADLFWLDAAQHPGSSTAIAPPGWKPDEDKAVYCLRKAVEEGYPAAHLDRQRGVDLLIQGRKNEAREAFRAALRAPLDLTDSKGYLASLGLSPDPAQDRKRPAPRCPNIGQKKVP